MCRVTTALAIKMHKILQLFCMCVCVFMYVFMYVCKYARMYVCMYMCQMTRALP